MNDSTTTEISVRIITRLSSRMNPAISSGMFISPIRLPTFQSVTLLTIVAIPVTPPGAISFGEVKLWTPSA